MERNYIKEKEEEIKRFAEIAETLNTFVEGWFTHSKIDSMRLFTRELENDEIAVSYGLDASVMEWYTEWCGGMAGMHSEIQDKGLCCKKECKDLCGEDNCGLSEENMAKIRELRTEYMMEFRHHLKYHLDKMTRQFVIAHKRRWARIIEILAEITE